MSDRAQARFRIEVTNPAVLSGGGTNPRKLPLLLIRDALDCQSWLCNPNVGARAVVLDALDNVVPNVTVNNIARFRVNTTDFQPFSFVSPTRPWLAPGERVWIEFDVQTPPSADEDCENTAYVRGREENCAADSSFCDDDDSAEIHLREPSIVCEKSVRAPEVMGAGSFEERLELPEGTEFPITLQYRFLVRNNGEVPLVGANICDDELKADVDAVPGVSFGQCNGLDANGCFAIGALMPNQSATRTCDVVILDEDAFVLWAMADDDGDDEQYTNMATASATSSTMVEGIPLCGTREVDSTCPAHVRVRACPGCPKTKAKFDIWNENEVRFSGTERCVRSWDQEWLSQYTAVGSPNHFILAALQTDKGKARIDGLRSPVVCPRDPEDPDDVDSEPLPLIGVKTQRVEFGPGAVDTAGTSLVGTGSQCGQIVHDLPTGGDELVLPPDHPHSAHFRQVHESATGGNTGFGVATCNPGDELPGPLVDDTRVDVSTKGSLLVYSKVEVKWDQTGTVIQDTIITITNDHGDEVFVQLYFVNGDQPTATLYDNGDPPMLVEREHPGCNRFDNIIRLTGDESTYWSALSGAPKGVSPWTLLDPGYPEGRPDTDPYNPGGRVLRGYVIAWAQTHDTGQEVRWNHLLGSATIVNYHDTSAWTYPAWSFQAIAGENPDEEDDTGNLLLEPFGTLDLNGVEYEFAPARLILDFYAVGATLASGGSYVKVLDTDITLWAVLKDLRQDCPPPQP